MRTYNKRGHMGGKTRKGQTNEDKYIIERYNKKRLYDIRELLR